MRIIPINFEIKNKYFHKHNDAKKSHYEFDMSNVNSSSELISNYNKSFIGLSFGRKKKDIDKSPYGIDKLRKRLTKNGCGAKNVDKILSDKKKTEKLKNFLIAYDKKEIEFSRELRDREIVFFTENEFDNEEIQKYINLSTPTDDKTRALTTKEAIDAIKHKLKDTEIQRYINLIDGDVDSEFPLSSGLDRYEAIYAIKRNYNNKQAETYKILRTNGCYYKDEFLNKKANCERFLELIYPNENIKISRPLSAVEAYRVIDNKFDMNQTQRLIDLQEEENNPLKLQKPATLGQAMDIIRNNYDDYQANIYTRLHDFIFHDTLKKIVENKEKSEKFLSLTEKGFDDVEAATCTTEDLTDDQIEKFKGINKSIQNTRWSAVIVKEFLPIFGKQNYNELTKKERRTLLKQIMKYNSSLFGIPKETLPLVPKNREEYCKVLPQIANSIGITTSNLSSRKKGDCLNGLKNIQNEINSKNINDILTGLPELKNELRNKKTLAFLDRLINNQKFKTLEEKDKEVLVLSTLLYNIAGQNNTEDSSFDAFYIIQKLNLDEISQKKIYALIKSQNWLEESANSIEETAQNLAFTMRNSNTYELLKIWTSAKYENIEDEENYNKINKLVKKYIQKLKETQIILPQTKIPKASKIKNGTIMSADGVKNTVLFMNDLDEDLSKYGFEKGTTKSNFMAIVHGLDTEIQMSNFSTFNIVDADALISTSHMNIKDYHVFRKQGLILDVNQDDIHAGYYRDFGSGCKKDLTTLKEKYLFAENTRYNKRYKEYRTYISDAIKKEMKISSQQYAQLTDKIKDVKSITDIEKIDKNLARSMYKILKDMELGKRSFNREYNEVLVSNPKIQGIFNFEQPYEEIPLFLRKYAEENDIPILVFGDLV